MEPPVSSPRDVAQRKAAVAAPEPLLEVPGFLAAVPGISGRAPMMIDAVAGGEFAHVELAEQDCAGVFEVGDYGCVVIGYVGGEDLGAAGGEDARGVELVLDGDGDAVERAAMFASGDFFLCLLRGGEGVVAADGDVAVELAVDAVDSFQVGFDGFNGGDFLSLNQSAEGRGGQEGDGFGCSLACLLIGVDDWQGFHLVETRGIQVVEKLLQSVDVVGYFSKVGFLKIQPGGLAQGPDFFFCQIGHERCPLR